MTINILLTIYAALAIYFMNCIGVNRVIKNTVAIILGLLIGDLYAGWLENNHPSRTKGDAIVCKNNEDKLKRKLKRISKNLNSLLLEIREHYPDANYIVEGGVISVIPECYEGGESHSSTGSIMESDFINNLDCGLWN